MIGFGQHDAAAFATSIAGILLDGFGKEQAIKIEPNADHRTTQVSVDGHVVSSKLNDKSAKVTVTLLETSSAHRALMALYNLDVASLNGAGIGTFEMRDLINGDVETSPEAWIARRPDRIVQGEAAEYEWTLGLSRWGTVVPT